jgi:DNA integrity scanning protein DisA with diadenylate cyclase activity
VEYLTADVFKNRNLNIEWSEDLIEKIFANKVLTVRFVLSALTNVKNIFFIEKVLKDSSFKYEPTNETFNVELKNFINRISENQIGYLFDILRTNNPAAFTYDLLGYILNMKDYLTEDFLIENSDLFLKNALFDELVKYARFKDYMDLLVLLKLNEN